LKFNILSRKTFYFIESFWNRKSRAVVLSSHIRNWGLAARTQVSKFLQSCHGTTAVEFGLIALPFFALSGGCLENGLTYWQQEILQDAVNDASRHIYTGSFQMSNAGTTDTATLIGFFRSAVCTRPNGKARVTIFDCNNVRVSVMKASTYAAATPTAPTAINANGISDWNPGFSNYTCAGASDIMIVQAAVDIPEIIDASFKVQQFSR
jgi:pilus assembly protein Flp/PilA